MKKILVVLLILAVAGGVFAQQGEWTLSGDARIGSQLRFNQGVDENVAWVRGWAMDPIEGTFNLNYGRDNLTVGLGFNARGEIMGTSTFNGENYSFVVQAALDKMLNFNGNYPNDAFNAGSINRLWGDYSFFSGLAKLEVAYKSRDFQVWNSDTSGVFGWSDVKSGSKKNAAKAIDAFGGPGDTFTKIDKQSMLLASFAFAGLDFGVQMRNLFGIEATSHPGTIEGSADDVAFIPIVPDVFRDTLIFGVKFAMAPLEVAAQFNFAEYGIYLGGKFLAGPITAGLSFMGLLREEKDPLYLRNMKAGVDVGFDGGMFGAGIRGFYAQGNNVVGGKDFDRTLGIEPRFSINAIPSHLRFALDAGFYFPSEYASGKLDRGDVLWGVSPRIDWNFRGTGATNDVKTGMVFKYAIVSDSDGQIWGNKNELDIVFKWNFF